MKSVGAFLSDLAAEGIKIWTSEGKLKFSAPKGRLTAEHKTLLKERKQEILAFLSRTQTGREEKRTYKPVSRQADLPLSFAQQRMWLVNQLEPDSNAYNVCTGLRMKGKLDENALNRAIHALIERHEALRTHFPVLQGEPSQVIKPVENYAMAREDLTHMPDEERPSRMKRIATEEFTKPFNLNDGPLFRARLLRLNFNDHVLLIGMHHIISDAWSMGILIHELSTLYLTFCQGKPSPLPPLPIQYADFSYWQRQWIAGSSMEAQSEFWRRRLAEPLPDWRLPFDLPGNARDMRGDQVSTVLPKETTAEFRAFCRSVGATPFMALFTVFNILLYRLTGEEDLIVGSPVSGRNDEVSKSLLGCFLNTLALRNDLSGNPDFKTLMERVRKSTMEAYANQDIPFEKLLEDLKVKRNLDRHPLFDILFNHINAPQSELNLPDLELEPVGFSEPDAKFDMTFYVNENPDQLGFQLVFKKALFAKQRVQLFLDQYLGLLNQVMTAPETPIRSYSLITDQAKALIPDPTAPFPKKEHASLPELFVETARANPSRLLLTANSSATRSCCRMRLHLRVFWLTRGLHRQMWQAFMVSVPMV